MRVGAIVFCISLFLCSGIASAAQCINDTDCPGPGCGGQVCRYSGSVHTCVNVPLDPGYCTTDPSCKCVAEGATCNVMTHQCSFTKKDVVVDPDAGTATGNNPFACAMGHGDDSFGRFGFALLLALAFARAFTRRRRAT